jgi:hypothetical protein
VVDAADDRGPVPGQRQDVEPPERPGVVEPLGKELAHRRPKLLVGERIGVIGLGDVPVEIDVLRLDPGRAPQPQAWLDDPLSEAGERADPLRDPLAQLRDRRRPAARVGSEDQHLAGVALDHLRLQAQDLGVVLAQSLPCGCAHGVIFAPGEVSVIPRFSRCAPGREEATTKGDNANG